MRQCPRSGNLSWKVCELAPQERVQNRARELFVDLPVPQIKEDVEKLGDFVQPVPSERIQQRILDQISLVLRIMEKIGGCCTAPRLRKRIQERIVEQISLVRGTDFCGAPDHGEKWASDSARASGACPRTNRGADFCGSPDHGEKWASDHRGGFAGVDCGCPCASDH